MSDENSGMESEAAASSTQTAHCFQGFHEASQVQNPVSFRLPQTQHSEADAEETASFPDA
jgi:hypothetical protein